MIFLLNLVEIMSWEVYGVYRYPCPRKKENMRQSIESITGANMIQGILCYVPSVKNSMSTIVRSSMGFHAMKLSADGF